MPGKSLRMALQIPLAQVQQAIHAARQGQESFVGLLTQHAAFGPQNLRRVRAGGYSG